MEAAACNLAAVCSKWKRQQGCPGHMALLAVHNAGEAEEKEATMPKNGIDVTGAKMQDPMASRNHASVSAGLTVPVPSGKSMVEVWAEEAHVKLIGHKLQGRRQPRGNNSSAETMALLDKSVIGKGC